MEKENAISFLKTIFSTLMQGKENRNWKSDHIHVVIIINKKLNNVLKKIIQCENTIKIKW